MTVEANSHILLLVDTTNRQKKETTMRNLDDMTRQELENLVFCEDIVPGDTIEETDAIQAMSKENLRAAVDKWMEDGDECAI